MKNLTTKEKWIADMLISIAYIIVPYTALTFLTLIIWMSDASAGALSMSALCFVIATFIILKK